MADHHIVGVALRVVGQKIKSQSLFRRVEPIFQRQAQAQQRIEQPVLGRLYLAPEHIVAGH
jgi:hypothetical protein